MGHRGMTRGNDGIWPLQMFMCVCMFQERDILEVVWVGKEGLTDKMQWETGDPISGNATFNVLLLCFPAL